MTEFLKACGNVAWACVVAYTLYAMGNSGVLRRLTRLKTPIGIEASFRELTLMARQGEQKAGGRRRASARNDLEHLSGLMELASERPLDATRLSWHEVRSLVNGLADRHGVLDGVNTVDRIEKLYRSGLLPKSSVGLASTLRRTYIQIKKDPRSLTARHAQDFIGATGVLCRMLQD